jgi:hypothetical protein
MLTLSDGANGVKVREVQASATRQEISEVMQKAAKSSILGPDMKEKLKVLEKNLEQCHLKTSRTSEDKIWQGLVVCSTML